MNMRKLIYVLSLTGIVLIASCNKNEERALEGRSKRATTDNKLSYAVISDDSTVQSIQEIKLKAIGNTIDQMAFNKDTIKIRVGALARIEFINEGTELPMIHNFVVVEAGTYKAAALAGEKAGSPGNYLPPKADLLAASPLALPGQTVIVEFKAPLKPAVYDFVCTYPGHWKNMHGTIIVN
jgi:azurin